MDTTEADRILSDVQTDAEKNPRPHEVAKREVEETVNRLVTLVRRDRINALRRIAQRIDAASQAAMATDTPVLLPMPGELLARELFDSWTPEERAGVLVYEGYCFTAKHQWFVVDGDPEEVLEPMWRYVIDPLPVGILVFGAEVTAAPAGVLVTSPMSPWQRIYTGLPEAEARRRESQQ